MGNDVGVVVERLRARHGEIEEAIYARVLGEGFDRVGDGDAEYVAGLRAAVAAAVQYGLEGIEHGTEGAGPIPVLAVEQARRAARIGVSLDTVLRRYVVGHTLLGEFVLEEADRGDRPSRRSALRRVLRAQAGAFDRLLAAVTREYSEELRRAASSPGRRRAERVQALLLDHGLLGAGEPDHGSSGEDPGRDFGYELDGWHLGVIATGAGAARSVRELAEGVGCRLLSVPQGQESVWAWLGGGGRLAFVEIERVIAGIDDIGSQRPGSHPLVMLAFGEPARDLPGWRLTHQQAQAALVVALRRPRRLTRYADVALLAAALKDRALAGALVDLYIAPLEDSRGGGAVLCQVLRAYLDAERSVSSAAAALGVVRKTVESRLRTIEQRLGRTLHPCPAELEVALALHELTAAPEPPEILHVGEIIA